VRLSVSLVALLMLFASVSASHGGEDDDDSFGFRTEQSCYNYTFIDNNSIRGTLLEKEEMDSYPGKPDAVSYDAVSNLCKPDSTFQLAAIEKADTPDTQSGDSEGLSETPILLNTRVKFIEEGKLSYEQLQSKETIFYGGLVPFVAVHDADLETDDHFFNPESFSLFLYFKRKF
jgi:hypothetical protein